MTWEEVCADPRLEDLPYKIELNKWGNIEMSPARNRHGEFQLRIGYLLQMQMPDGIAQTECAVQTTENVKVPDVAWISFAHRRATPHEFAYDVAPEICVEIISPTNIQTSKCIKASFICKPARKNSGSATSRARCAFSMRTGPMECSRRCPGFPMRVEIPE